MWRDEMHKYANIITLMLAKIICLVVTQLRTISNRMKLFSDFNLKIGWIQVIKNNKWWWKWRWCWWWMRHSNLMLQVPAASVEGTAFDDEDEDEEAVAFVKVDGESYFLLRSTFSLPSPSSKSGIFLAFLFLLLAFCGSFWGLTACFESIWAFLDVLWWRVFWATALTCGKSLVMLPTAFVRPSLNTILMSVFKYSGFLMKRNRTRALSPVLKCSSVMVMMVAVCRTLPTWTGFKRKRKKKKEKTSSSINVH